jgi:hypothetical protein
VIKTTPAITNKIPTPVVQWNGSRKMRTESSATIATGPDVSTGMDNIQGRRARAAA